MTDRPIIFSPPMVRALLEGRKTQTRRLATSPLRRCEVGDRLYVREAWRTDGQVDAVKPTELSQGEPIYYDVDGGIRATGCVMIEPGRLRPGMHMPRWASRLTLIVEQVWHEPLRAIPGHDAMREGVEREGGDWKNYAGGEPCLSAREGYATLWDALHTDEGERWQDNPQIVALSFRIERVNVDRLPA